MRIEVIATVIITVAIIMQCSPQQRERQASSYVGAGNGIELRGIFYELPSRV
jgi:hypothetical protein